MWYSDKGWWKMALDRAIRSLAQGALVGVGENVCVQDFDWKFIVGAGVGMFIISIATSVAFGLPEYKEG